MGKLESSLETINDRPLDNQDTIPRFSMSQSSISKVICVEPNLVERLSNFLQAYYIERWFINSVALP